MSAVSNAFRILQVVTAAGSNGLPFARIVDATGIPKASAHRLLGELVELTALRLDPSTRCYHGGLMLARIGAAVMSTYDLRSAIRPFLQALHDETGHVATLGVRDEGIGTYIDKIEPADFRIRLHSEVGKQFPLHCTAMGKVLLSYADVATVTRVLKRKLEAFTPNTIIRPRRLREELAEVRRRGYAIDGEEITRGLVCVAAPVHGASGEVAGAMSCTFASYIQQERSIQPEIDAVLRCAAQASRGPSADAVGR